jgi:DNA polymerase I-like protein with 3'-5' exonuclease and polymerase domains|tara:strand:- start:1401 stop:3299 length:1899 start_codon:yes stop_codon:yes gene_type:complete
MAGNLQMAMFAPKSEWIPPMELPDITTAKKIAIDVETRDPDIKTNGPGWATGNGEVVGYAVAVDGWSGYIPIRHLGGGNLDEKIVNKWLKKVFECPADKIMHNAQYDAGWIKRMGFDLKGRIIDTMLIASLLDENRYSYSLNALSYDLLGKTKSEKGLVEAARSFGVDPKAEMWKLPAMHVGAYGEADAELALELWNYFSIQLGKEDLWGIANLELELLPCLIEMTWRGVRVDQDRVEKTRNSLVKREREVMKEIKKIAGRDVEIWAAQSLVKAFDKVGLQYPKTEKGAPSFTKLFLQENPHPLAQLIVEARNLNKTTGTFLNTIMKHCHADGRIHSHINQIRSDDGGTVSGRLSMNSPNLQQIPARDPEIGPMIRSLFLPEEGEQWAAIDFSQQEPRILVHYAHVYGESRNLPLEGALDFVEAYNEDPSTDFHTMVAEMANIPRKQAKVINLGMMYGMGVGKLSEQLDISMDDAKELIGQYHKRVPFVKGLMNGVMNRLNDKASSGSIRSILGRKCRFDRWEPDTFAMNKALPYQEAVQEYGATTRLKRAYTYKALNRLIQASAADMTKKAMVDLYKEGLVPLTQIHDEIAMSVKDKEQAKYIADIMTKAVPLQVPNKCDIEIGPSWGEAK